MKEVNSNEWNAKDADSLVGYIMSKLKCTYQCKVEKWTTEGNILVNEEDTGITNVPATILFDILEEKGYRVIFGVLPECYPIYVAK